MNFVFDFLCVGTVYVSSMTMVLPSCVIRLSSNDLQNILKQLSLFSLKACRVSPLFIWIPNYASSIDTNYYSDNDDSLPPSLLWPFSASDDVNITIPSGLALASTGQPSLAGELSDIISRNCRSIGFHVTSAWSLQVYIARVLYSHLAFCNEKPMPSCLFYSGCVVILMDL